MAERCPYIARALRSGQNRSPALSLTRRRANALELIGAVPKPNLPDIATDKIRVESALGAKPIRVLTYRPVTSDDPLPVILQIMAGLGDGRAGNEGCGK